MGWTLRLQWGLFILLLSLLAEFTHLTVIANNEVRARTLVAPHSLWGSPSPKLAGLDDRDALKLGWLEKISVDRDERARFTGHGCT